jgi:hypothetical protein
MSSRVYIDTRAYQLQQSSQLIRMAMEQLGAQKSQISCGTATVRSTDIDAVAQRKQMQELRFQDKVETASTNDLQRKLNAVAPDYTVAALGDWAPVDSTGHADATVEIDEAMNGTSNMTLIEDLECAALDGARMMIFQVEDDHGNTSYKIGIEDSAFDSQGNWLNQDAQKAYQQFLSAAVAANAAAIDEDPKAQRTTANRLNTAMDAAGLEDAGAAQTPTGATAHRFSTSRVGQNNAPANTRTMNSSGGE